MREGVMVVKRKVRWIAEMGTRSKLWKDATDE